MHHQTINRNTYMDYSIAACHLRLIECRLILWQLSLQSHQMTINEQVWRINEHTKPNMIECLIQTNMPSNRMMRMLNDNSISNIDSVIWIIPALRLVFKFFQSNIFDFGESRRFITIGWSAVNQMVPICLANNKSNSTLFVAFSFFFNVSPSNLLRLRISITLRINVLMSWKM